jgi:hypothetical protein
LLVSNNVVPSSLIQSTLMMEVITYFETFILTRTTLRHITEDDILHNDIKSYIALTGWAPYQRCNVSPVKYELGFYIPEDDILHSHRRENLKSYIALTGWTV